ncbi:MAG: hypothetical protein KDK39_10470 [Leptospiraceae bacterium]|nr:hypothetical protein [Leptospiraceae bacterium]
MLKSFIYILRGYGLPAGLGAILDFYRGLRLGLVQNLDELFDLGALCFVKRVRQMDLYERAFVYFFCGVDLPPVAEGDPAVLQSKQFREWLSQAVLSGQIQPVTQNLSPAELMERFWQTVREQMEAHHGGNRWVGTGGTSPFGHSGFSQAGIRVQGSSKYRSAMRVFGDRRYINYSEDLMIDDAPLARILETLRRLRPRGAATELNIAESVYQSARNAGELELIFQRPLRENHELILLIDNGGSSMLPWAELTQKLFGRIHRRFQHSHTYFFHNTIYERVYLDARRTRQIALERILTQHQDPMVIIIGDASMNPYELGAPWGASDPRNACPQSSIFYLERLRRRLRHSVWLNPIPKRSWDTNQAGWSVERIRQIFFMEDLSLRGLKRSIDYLLAMQ